VMYRKKCLNIKPKKIYSDSDKPKFHFMLVTWRVQNDIEKLMSKLVAECWHSQLFRMPTMRVEQLVVDVSLHNSSMQIQNQKKVFFVS